MLLSMNDFLPGFSLYYFLLFLFAVAIKCFMIGVNV